MKTEEGNVVSTAAAAALVRFLCCGAAAASALLLASAQEAGKNIKRTSWFWFIHIWYSQQIYQTKLYGIPYDIF